MEYGVWTPCGSREGEAEVKQMASPSFYSLFSLYFPSPFCSVWNLKHFWDEYCALNISLQRYVAV
jgi:hypothetical protein